MTDITEHPTREGRVYCAVVLDVWSRRVIGWAIDSTPSTALVTNALGMALEQRRPRGATIIHSDQGTQFTSWAFTRRAVDSGLLPSMGSVGDCYDCDDPLALPGAAGPLLRPTWCPCVDVSVVPVQRSQKGPPAGWAVT